MALPGGAPADGRDLRCYPATVIRDSHRYLLFAAFLCAALAGSLPSAAAPGDPPARLVPLPGPPPGPSIKRVRLDARRPLRAGDRLPVTVEAEPGARVTARLGSQGTPAVCAAAADRPSTYLCALVVPTGITGRHHVIAEATGDAPGRSRLSSLLPVEIVERDQRQEMNALNVQLRPAYFASRSHQLDEEAREAVRSNLPVLQGHPDLPIVVEGHCDPQEGGDPATLSRQRAEAVVEELAAQGIPRSRLAVSAVGCGEPVVFTDGEEARAPNRRAMILFELADSP